MPGGLAVGGANRIAEPMGMREPMGPMRSPKLVGSPARSSWGRPSHSNPWKPRLGEAHRLDETYHSMWDRNPELMGSTGPTCNGTSPWAYKPMALPRPMPPPQRSRGSVSGGLRVHVPTGSVGGSGLIARAESATEGRSRRRVADSTAFAQYSLRPPHTRRTGSPTHTASCQQTPTKNELLYRPAAQPPMLM